MDWRPHSIGVTWEIARLFQAIATTCEYASERVAWRDTPFAVVEGIYHAVMVYAWRP